MSLTDAEKAAKYDAIIVSRQEKMREWRKLNADRYKEYQRAYKLAHKDELRAYDTARKREARHRLKAEAVAQLSIA